VLRYGDEIGRLLLTGPGYSAHVLTFSCRRDQTVRLVTATNVTFLTVAIYLLDLAIKVVALGLVPEGPRPSSATAWLLLILFLPVIGLLAFWLIGSPFVDRGRRRQQAAAGEVISGALTAEANDLLPVPAGSTLNTLVVLNRRLGWLPSVGGNKECGRFHPIIQPGVRGLGDVRQPVADDGHASGRRSLPIAVP
jgi:Phospholipase_D-nuclease N-terminal